MVWIRLEKAYGSKYFNEERKKIFFESLKFFTLKQLDEAVNKVIVKTYYPAKLEEILALIKIPNQDKKDFLRKPSKECRNCEGTGYVWAYMREQIEKYEFVFRCPCVVGTQIKLDAPTWNSNLDAEYEIIRRKNVSQTK